MKKQDLIKLAVMGITAGGFISATCGNTGAGTGSNVNPQTQTAPAPHTCSKAKINDSEKYPAPDFGGESTVAPSQQPQGQPAHSCSGQKQKQAHACNGQRTAADDKHDCKGKGGCKGDSYTAGTPQGNTAQMKAKRSLSR